MHRRLVFALLCAWSLGMSGSALGQSAPLSRDEPPRADRITVSAPDENGQVRIEGRLNSIFPGAVVGVRDLFSGETAFTQAGLNGAFSARLPGVDGNPYLIQGDNSFPANTAPLPAGLPGDIGVIVNAPLPDDGFGIAGVHGGQRWTADGAASSGPLIADTVWNLRLHVTTPESLPFGADVLLQPIAQAVDGALQPASVAGSSGWTAETTGTGLALDGLAALVPWGALTLDAVTTQPDGGLAYALLFNAPPPEDLSRGLYAPLLRLPDGAMVRLPLVLRAGSASRTPLPLVLFMNDGTDGSRGLLPEGGVGALSHGARWNGPTFILPPGDYPLEPYVPVQLLNHSDAFAPPLIPFDLPGGELIVTVQRPDGQSDRFSAPFTQNAVGTTAQDERERFGGGPVDVFRLTTSDPELAAYAFDQYGDYQITVNAQLSDRFGNPYAGGGVYRLRVAEPLELRPGLLPGAPIPAGDAVDAGLTISPPVPATITAALSALPLEGDAETMRLSGQADRYGRFAPASPFTPAAPGEYVMDYSAVYTDDGGRLWAGSLRGAGVVTDPASPLIVHGGRGVLGQPDGTAPARYSLAALSAQAGGATFPDAAVLKQPFYAGTTARMGSDSLSGLAFPLHLQDSGGEFARAVVEAGAADELAAARGELPAAVPGLSRAYSSAVTPGFSVRQQVTGGASPGLPEWVSADDPLNQQIGAGAAGLAPGDLVFLFGGTVAPTANTAAGYALLVVVTDDDPEALGVFAPPPAGAAPLAIIPLGLGPGQRVTVGAPLAISAQVAPPLPARVTATFTRPDGTTESTFIQANAFGYAFDPDAAFIADQPGVWSVRLMAQTNAGEAGVPGASDGTFLFYVLPEDAAPLAWAPAIRDTEIPGATAYNFNFTAPEGWDDVRAFWTMTTPGAVLADGEARLAGRSLSAAYNPVDLRADFPNFEVEGRANGPQGSDPVTITVAFTGVDTDGAPQIRARTFTIFHDRLIALEARP